MYNLYKTNMIFTIKHHHQWRQQQHLWDKDSSNSLLRVWADLVPAWFFPFLVGMVGVFWLVNADWDGLRGGLCRCHKVGFILGLQSQTRTLENNCLLWQTIVYNYIIRPNYYQSVYTNKLLNKWAFPKWRAKQNVMFLETEFILIKQFDSILLWKYKKSIQRPITFLRLSSSVK